MDTVNSRSRPGEEYAIEVRTLTKTYGNHTAVDDVSFGVRPGVVTGFLVAFFVLPNLSGALFGSVSSLKYAGRWIDVNQAQGNLYDHVMNGRHWAQLLVATLLWVLIPAVLGGMRVLRSEVKSS